MGFCKECDCAILDIDCMYPDYPNVYQCRWCGQPHTIDEMCKERPLHCLILEDGCK